MCRLDPLEHRHRFCLTRSALAEIERNAADIALMGDVGRPDLERDRETRSVAARDAAWSGSPAM